MATRTYKVVTNMVVIRTGPRRQNGKFPVRRFLRGTTINAEENEEQIQTLLAGRGIALAEGEIRPDGKTKAKAPRLVTVGMAARAQGGLEDPVTLPSAEFLPLGATPAQVADTV